VSDVHEGGCLCGAVRYRVSGTGSAFGIGAGVEVFEKGTLPPKK